jgi:prepilin-type N-terminal cleavage/methylation domain-containing protein
MKLLLGSYRRAAFTLVEIMIVMAIIGLLCAIVIPNYVRARANAQASSCINNLRKIEDASAQYAIESRKTAGASVSLTTDLTPYIKLTKGNTLPACPASGTYSITTIGTPPTCSLGSSVQPAHIIP